MKYQKFLPYQGISLFDRMRWRTHDIRMTPWALPDPRYNTVPRGRAKRNFYKWFDRPQKSYLIFWRSHPELTAKIKARKFN